MQVTKKWARVNLIVLLSLVVLGLFFPKRADAAGLTISPTYQELQLTTEVVASSSAITLTNQTDQALDLELFAVDFQSSDHFGSLSFISTLDERYPHSLSPYISIAQPRILLEPGATQKITFTVTDRVSLTPGGHYAAVVARVVTQAVAGEQKVQPALASLVLVRKTAGEVLRLNLKTVDWNPGWIIFSLPKQWRFLYSNEGNTHLTPRGTLVVHDIFSRILAQHSLNQDSHIVLPGTERQLLEDVSIRRPWLPITLATVRVEGRTDEGETPFAWSQSAIYVQPIPILGICLGGLSVWWFMRSWRHHRRKKL